MTNPLKVNQSKFPVDESNLIYNKDSFSLAFSEYDGGREGHSLGIRWNGSESGLGFPNIFGNAIWFILPDKLAIPILSSLLVSKDIDEETESNIFNAIKELKSKI